MKKILAILLTLVMVMSMFAGCGAPAADEPTTAPTETMTEAPTEVTTEPSVETTEAPTEETTVPETEAPAEAPTETPTEAPEAEACKHDYKKTVIAPTTTAQGYTLYECKKCGYEYKSDYTDKLPSSGGNENHNETEPTVHQHDYISEVTVEPACDHPGGRTYTCQTCGHSYDEEMPTLEHDWTGWGVTKEPTTESEGQEMRKCKVCGFYEHRAIDKLPSDKLPSDNDNSGEGGYYYGLGNLKIYHDCAAKGHLEGTATTIQEATCAQPRITQVTCKVIGCGATWTIETESHKHHTMSASDNAKIYKSYTFYSIKCACGMGCHGNDRNSAMVAFNAHVAEQKYDHCGTIDREFEGHRHSIPGGTFICTVCNNSVSFSDVYAQCSGTGTDCTYD